MVQPSLMISTPHSPVIARAVIIGLPTMEGP